MITRRQFMTTAGAVGAVVVMPNLLTGGLQRALGAAVPGGTLDPTTITKYVTPLYVLPAMPPVSTTGALDLYDIAARQFSQQILPRGLPASTVFGYGSTGAARSFHAPSWTVEASVNRPVRTRWSNQLTSAGGAYLPPLLPVDPTLHWANPAGGTAGRDSQPTFTSTPTAYRGPVPLVTHLHGGHSFEESDGYPEAWTLAAARNIPAGYATVGSYYNQFMAEAAARNGTVWTPGSSTLQYTNDQRATALWYHDHALGMTRTNVYSGLAGYYLLRGGSADLAAGVLPGPAPRLGDPAGARYYEIPLIIADKSFNVDGSLFFPASRDFFGDAPAGGPFVPFSDVPPIWNPEFFGSTMTVNGNTWPTLTVEARRYRFRMINTCNARSLLLKIVTDPTTIRPASAALPLWAIGTDGGFLPAPAQLSAALIAPSERLDLIVDFTGVRPGTALYLINEAPDFPYNGSPVTADNAADPGTTGQVMKFVVTAAVSADTSVPPAQLTLPTFHRQGAAAVTRQLSLNELDSVSFPDSEAPIQARLGTINPDGTGNPLRWMDAVTEKPAVGVTEVWEINNFTEDAHPVHVHQVQFEVQNRQPFGGSARPPETWETGAKDVVISLPQETTRLKATFDLAGRYVWHCHILDHEDNEMMRPFQVSCPPGSALVRTRGSAGAQKRRCVDAVPAPTRGHRDAEAGAGAGAATAAAGLVTSPGG